MGTPIAKYPRGLGPVQKRRSPRFPPTNNLHPGRAYRAHRYPIPRTLLDRSEHIVNWYRIVIHTRFFSILVYWGGSTYITGVMIDDTGSQSMTMTWNEAMMVVPVFLAAKCTAGCILPPHPEIGPFMYPCGRLTLSGVSWVLGSEVLGIEAWS